MFLNKRFYYRKFSSPIGCLQLVSDKNNLLKIQFGSEDNFRNSDLPILIKTEKQLQEYFVGKRKQFEIPYKLEGTKFQIKVWEELNKIPFGETISYKTLATRVGNKNKARAAGNANGKNPLPIIIPCHRVIASDGSLGGYDGGIDNKEYLLELERN